ncbi:hypothetical protein PAE9249_03700 [Paenibacillus sp. CECT 9249]|nr:hypothetical protein PAE9249_03700 [Paenibacillus sp. CECT 9249]
MLTASAYVAFFIGALTLALPLIGGISNALDVSYIANAGGDRNIHSGLSETGNYTVNGAVVLHTVFQIGQLHADIEVDGQRLAHTAKPETADVSVIDVHASYRVTYVRDGNGTIILVRYDSVRT